MVAIAMTLLGIDLSLPHGETNAEVWHSFVDLLPKEYLVFLIGFAVIALFWMNHHQLFRRIHVVDPTLRRLNMLWLFLIAVAPFATRLDSVDGGFVLGPVFYAVVIAALALVLTAMSGHASRHGLVRPGTPDRVMRSFVVGGYTAAGVFLISIPVSFVSTSWGRYVWLLMVVASYVTDRFTERRAHPAG
ncbi:putative membrane protein [Amycolatopsis jiangsuensis]|uniref:Putative membrane protein n=1 Tax=Amycolatopsis jiangsuensis TaxID=1181879 RepID=A0A840IZE7_9PSEU|nr:putative membrane protein [Amycolatopsis jiangsuensis]